MPQEFYVLKCFSCETFQVHIVKKAKKWECKMCGEKQSLKRNYGKGNSKDCRNQVMRLNELRLSKGKSLNDMEDEVMEETWIEDLNEQHLKDEPKEQKPLISKWAEYVEENAPNTESETDDGGDSFLLNSVDRKKKRMKKMPESCYSENKKICRKSSESEIFSKEFKKTAKLSSTSNNEKSFDCFDRSEQNTVRKDFVQFKNESKPGKYEKYLEHEENSYLMQKANKTSKIFESSLSDLDDILNL